MKSPRFRSLMIATAFTIPALAHAHPGHDGDHDFVWDFSHLASNPVATVACVALLVFAGWGIRRIFQSRPARLERVTRD
jgi:hypothetical protein